MNLHRTTTRTPFRAVVRLAATTATVAAVATSTNADVTIAEWTDAFHFDYHVNYMPDLDQRRVGLDGGGSMHCVPTSTMNIIAYAAQWAFEDLDPGPGTWTGYDDYYEMTAYIEDLGDLMGTTAEGGTGGSGKRDGLDAWIDGYPLVADYVWKSGDDCPTLSDIVKALEGGYVGCLSYGRYEWEWGFQGTMRLLDRTGGHAVTIMHASSDGVFSEELATRDPADDNPVDTFSQSPFAARVYSDVETTGNFLHDPDENGQFTSFEGTMLEFNPDSDRIRLIDAYVVLRPIGGYSYNHVQLAFEGLAGGGWITNGPEPGIYEFAELPILAAEPVLGFQDVLVLGALSEARSTIVPVNRLLGPGPAAAEASLVFPAHDLYIDPRGAVFAAGPTRIERRHVDRLHQVDAMTSLDPPIDAMAGDDDRRVLWLISQTTRTLSSLGLDLDPQGRTDHPLPTWLPTTPVRDLVVCPASGALWCLFQGDDRLFRLEIAADGSVAASTASDPAMSDPESVTCDDRGHVIASAGGSLHAFRPTSAGFQRYDDPWYAATQPMGAFRVDRSRTNFDPVEHSAPGWNTNIPAEELEPGTSIPDCPGDVDGDGMIGFADLVGILGAWDTASPLHDVAPPGGDGIVGLGDLLVVLGAWGPCS